TRVTSSSAQDASTYGDPVTFTATVSNSDTGVAPAGSVEFYDGSADLGHGAPAGAGGNSSTWTLSTSALAAGLHAIEAIYTPTSNPQDFLGSGNSGALLTQTVNAAPLTVRVNDSSKVYGRPNPGFSVSYDGFVP